MAQPPPVLIHRRYRVLAPLGAGGLATAFRVWDEAAEEERALKLVDADAIEPLRHEFGLLAGLGHPRLTRVHDFGRFRQSGALRGYYTADLLLGETLERFTRPSPRKRRRWSTWRQALVHALEGLAFLHDLGIRHGDFKPSNVMVDRAGRGTLIDLSCAARLQSPVREIAGTPGFFAPELRPGAMVDGRADLFAVGITLQRLAPGDPEAADLARRLTLADPSERPGEVADVLAALGVDRGLVTGEGTGRSPLLLGREDELARFDGWLRAFIDTTPGPRAIVLRGEEGMGKSRLLAELKWRAQTQAEVADAPAGGIRALLRRAGATVANDGQLDSVLRACESLGQSPEPRVLVVDDVDRLAADDHRELTAMLRSLPRDGRLMVMAASRAPLAVEGAAELVLAPMTIATIGRWADGRIAADRVDALERFTGGNPALLEAAFRGLGAGRWVESALETAPPLTPDDRLAAKLAPLGDGERVLLARLVARDGLASDVAEDADLGRLAGRGLVRADVGGYRLARPADRGAIERVLGSERMRQAYRDAAADADLHVPRGGRRLRALVRSGQLDEAERWLLRMPADSSPVASDAMAELVTLSQAPEVRLACAERQLHAGRSDRALSAVARLLRLRPGPKWRVPAQAIAGEAYLRAEQPQRAARQLRRAMEAGGEQASLVANSIRALNQNGAYAEARSLGERALQHSPDDGALSSGTGVAAMYLGDTEQAEIYLRRAAECSDGEPRESARVHSYLAILAFRAGDLDAAAAAHAEALAAAETHGLHDMLPTLVLNLGTARQQLGHWGEAIALYERGHRYAVALGKTHARSILELNLANLYAEVGLADRGATMLQRARASLRLAEMDHLDAHASTIAGEVALAREDRQAAAECFDDARRKHHERGERREEAEALVRLAGLVPEGAWLAQARAAVAAVEADDVAARLDVVEARSALQRGERARALECARRATRCGQALVVADAEQALAEVLQGDEAEQARARARASWEQVAARLPPATRDAFWRHPRRRALAPAAAEAEVASARWVDAARLRRMIELSTRVSSSLALDDVLESAMDAAIELTGAERGFLLLRDDDAMRVAIARNLDRQRLQGGELSFSTSIAERVVRMERPLTTLDAQLDSRFSDNRSVHAMGLKSVACVPVSARGVVLGALYLDNRFEKGRFADDDLGVVVALASHIAMALSNARLHRELEEHNKRLANDKRRVERQSRGQAQQIERLQARVRTQQEALERRYDYSAIVHRSAAMGEVFDLLDRVIDSDLTLLVEGESGTGKELIARAVHFNSPRRDRRFVSVNCGALSETLLESELFGHRKGAFTGADRDRAGLMVAAHEGTLFLDEVGELSLAMQVKLLRVLQEREVRPVGASEALAIDVRVVCATNRQLREEVAAGRFREDLYYRLGVVEVRLPPLRDRVDDILPIARALLGKHDPPPEIGRDAARAMLGYGWPGNVRQLENVLARAYVLSDRQLIREADLDLSARPKQPRRPRSRDEFASDEAERIHATLLANRWNVSRTARALGMPRNTLYRRMDKLGLSRS
jgi:transcriptional regulator with GAF, ATPase, and Fis domain